MLLSGCQRCSVGPLCAVGLSGSCQAVTLGPDSDGTPRLSDSAVRLSDTCCQTVGETKCSQRCRAVGHCQALSGGFAVRLKDSHAPPLWEVPRREVCVMREDTLLSVSRRTEDTPKIHRDLLMRVPRRSGVSSYEDTRVPLDVVYLHGPRNFTSKIHRWKGIKVYL